MQAGTLFIVSTPIGNLEDITLRAVRILRECDLVAAEDTRLTGMLLKHFNIDKPLTSYFEYNKQAKGGYILRLLKEGKNIALVSDAGTPCISDSGYLLIKEAREAGIPVVSVPGPSAVISALSISGLNTDSFVFLGFLKKKPSKRRKELEKFKDAGMVIAFYESPHRILAALDDVKQVLGDRRVALAREMTKKFEEVISGTVTEVSADLSGRKEVLGEFCVMVDMNENT